MPTIPARSRPERSKATSQTQLPSCAELQKVRPVDYGLYSTQSQRWKCFVFARSTSHKENGFTNTSRQRTWRLAVQRTNPSTGHRQCVWRRETSKQISRRCWTRCPKTANTPRTSRWSDVHDLAEDVLQVLPRDFPPARVLHVVGEAHRGVA